MDARTRLGWIRLYEQVGDAGLVCRRCGIARPGRSSGSIWRPRPDRPNLTPRTSRTSRRNRQTAGCEGRQLGTAMP